MIRASLPDRQLRNGTAMSLSPALSSLPDRQLKNVTNSDLAPPLSLTLPFLATP